MSLKYVVLNIGVYIAMLGVFYYGTVHANETGVVQSGPIKIIEPPVIHSEQSGHVKDFPNLHSEASVEVMREVSYVENHDAALGGAMYVPQEIVNLEEVDTSYQLGAGDKIKITVFGEKELSKTYTVSDKGIIAMPLVGDVQVRGKTVRQTRRMITALLADGYLREPDVVIEITQFRPVYIMGEVRNPGSFDYVADMTVLNAVAIAGGYTYRANQDEHEILRESDAGSIVYDDQPQGARIMPGDILLVKERFF